MSLLLVSACVADEAGISDNDSAGMGPAAGTTSAGGSEQQTGGAAPLGTGASAGSPAQVGGTDSEGGTMHGLAGAPRDQGHGGDVPGQGGAGEAGAGPNPVAMACVFHTDAVEPPSGEGGAPSATIVVQTNAFVGGYLTDTAGRTLYTYGGDLPGDCNTAPKSLCEADCAVSWPPFDAGSRLLGAGLDDAAFGSIARGDGSSQTTYYGWPLYYYKSDVALGQLTGQGKGKTWHAAEVTPAAVVILKAGTAKFLADIAGRTLYVSAADQAGTLETDPVSACDAACSSSFTPFSRKHLSVVTSLEESDFSVFVGKGVGLQLAYKGLPLYTAKADLKSGDMTGLASAGFTAAVP